MITDIEDLVSRFRTCSSSSAGTGTGTAAASFTASEIASCRTSLLQWYHAKRRHLPWRGDKPSAPNDAGFETPAMTAYGTWVSEIMLQQTRVETVIPYWHKWMVKFPTVESLAAASPEEVNTMWAGLGYYRRAQQLLQGAKKVMADFKGTVPGTVKELLQVPGIGPYTAGAIASIAFNEPVPLVDGNVIRVMSRLRALTSEAKSKDTDKTCWALGAAVVDPSEPGAFNQALMELGATVCKPTTPLCDTCPVREICHARKLAEYASRASSSSSSLSSSSLSKRKMTASSHIAGGDAGAEDELDEDADEGDPDAGLVDGLPTSVTYFPLRAPKKRPREVCVSVGVFRRQDGEGVGEQFAEWRYLFIRRPQGGLLQNQWEFPSVILWEEEGGKAKKGTKEKEKTGGVDTLDAVDTSPQALWAPFPGFLLEHISEAPPAELGTSASRKIFSPPVVHVFSHQRHTMHVHQQEWRSISTSATSISSDEIRRETRWMTATEIRAAGITSGCKKVLELVTKEEGVGGGEGTKRAAPKSSAKKAKTSAVSTPSITSFFGKKE